jgi:hypothetical protein
MYGHEVLVSLQIVSKVLWDTYLSIKAQTPHVRFVVDLLYN